MIIASVDPGLTGAMAMFDTRAGFVSVVDLPTHEIQVAKTTRRELDLSSLRLLLTQAGVEHVVIEKVASRPGQGVASVFKFGYTSGAIYGLVVGLRIPVTFLHPKQWQKISGVGPEPDQARRRASELYPGAAEYLTRKKDGGRADAILLAHAGLTLLPPTQRKAA